jgi:AcrR family transcriptional regulator
VNTSANRHRQPSKLDVVGDAILDATEHLLETHSLEDLRVADILSKAGASKAAFYGRFANKAAVVAELVRRRLDEAAPSIDAALQTDHARDRAQLTATLQQWLEALHRHRSLILATLDGRAGSPELAQIYQVMFARLRPRIPAEPTLAAGLLATAESVLEGYLRQSPHFTDAQQVALVMSTIYQDLI